MARRLTQEAGGYASKKRGPTGVPLATGKAGERRCVFTRY